MPKSSEPEKAREEAAQWWDENSYRFIEDDGMYDMPRVLLAYAASCESAAEARGIRKGLERAVILTCEGCAKSWPIEPPNTVWGKCHTHPSGGLYPCKSAAIRAELEKEQGGK